MLRGVRRTPPFPEEIQAWIIGYFTRVTGALAPLVALLLVYRWTIGVLDSGLAALALILFPLALLPWAGDRISLRAKAGIHLGVFIVSACVTFASSGIEGIGPLISVLAAFSAFLFFGNISFLIVGSLIFVLVWVSAWARLNGLVEPALDLDLPINVFGRALTLTLILGVLLVVLRGVVTLFADQRAQAARDNLRSERALSELNLFIDSANAPIFGIDTDGRINEWNAQAASITGVSKSEAFGKNLVEAYIAEDFKASVGGVLDRALSGVNTANFELPLYDQSGRPVEILLNATTRRDTEGAIIGVMGVGQDITRFREQERELRQAQKLEAVGLLTGGIAHDFNNLLTVISGNLELAAADIDEGEEASAVKELLSDAASASRDGAYLTSQLLTFAAPQSFALDSSNLQTLIGDTVRKASASLPSGIECSVDVEDDGILVMVDHVLLESSILNLLSNAAAAMKNGGSISVRCHKEQFLTSREAESHGVPVGEYIVISVGDDGCGIAERSLDQVKDPFFTTKGIGEGAGLGLSMVDSFATQLGGCLSIESTVDVGSLVTITIPLIRSELETPIEELTTQEEFSLSQETRRVLVVEDEARIRKIAVRHLVARGFRCIEAGDARQALEVLAAQAEGEGIDILFSDIRMPGDMTGRELAEEAARLYPRMKIALTTGYEQEESHSLGLAGTHAPTNLPVLRKPYSREGLIDLMSQLAPSEPA